MHYYVFSSVIFAIVLGQNALALNFANTVERATTFRLLESQRRSEESGNSSFQRRLDFEQGKARAQEMAGLIKDKEMKERAEVLTPIGERIGEDRYVGTPARAIGAGVALWVGRSFSLVSTGDLQIRTRVEGRARVGSLALDSRVVRSSVELRPGGALVAMNREVPLIQTLAVIHYDMRDRFMGAALSKAVLKNVVFSVGASDSSIAKKEGVAQIAYSVVL